MSDQLTLFNLNSVESVPNNSVHDPYSRVESVRKPVHDPYWDDILKESLLSEDSRGAITNSASQKNVEHVFCETDSVSEYAPTLETPLYSLTTQTESVSEYNRTPPTPPYSLTNEPQGINVYSPGGTATKAGKHKYFRCSCKKAGTTRHIHIPGGNIGSLLAQQNAEIIRQAFAAGRCFEEIKQIICSLPSARRWGNR